MAAAPRPPGDPFRLPAASGTDTKKLAAFPCHFAVLRLEGRDVRSPRTPGGLLRRRERAAIAAFAFIKQGLRTMATVKELKATARPSVGKGAARAERRAGRVPGVIYGNNQPPLPISVDDRELRQRILAGRFLTTIYDIQLDGKNHRVIPRDFHLDPVRDFP